MKTETFKKSLFDENIDWDNVYEYDGNMSRNKITGHLTNRKHDPLSVLDGGKVGLLLRELKRVLVPNSRAELAVILAGLKLVCIDKPKTEEEWRAFVDIYHSVLSEYPSELLDSAVKGWIKRAKSPAYMPTPADIRELVHGDWFKMKRVKDRLEKMLTAQ